MFVAALYLAIIIGQGETDQHIAESLAWFVLMAGAGLLALLADRAPSAGRRMVIAALIIFFVLGVVSALTLGILFLIAAILSFVAVAPSRSSAVDEPGPTSESAKS